MRFGHKRGDNRQKKLHGRSPPSVWNVCSVCKEQMTHKQSLKHECRGKR